MTFDEYINNPMGIANSVISNREMYRNLYRGKLDIILLREAGNVEYKLFKDNKSYYCYMKIPSEVVPNFYYDVVAQFTEPKDKIKKLDTTIKNYEVKFYSNDPSFVYTFCHAFIKNDMFINSYKDKMSKEAVKQNADIKNPKNTIGYVKSFYFMYILMIRKGLFNKIKYIDTYNEAQLKTNIMNASMKIDLRQKAEKDLKIAKKKAKQKAKSDVIDRYYSKESPISYSVNKVKKIGKTKSINSVKKTKRV